MPQANRICRIDQAEASDRMVEILTVNYQFQRGGNRMPRLSAPPMSAVIPTGESSLK